MKKVIGLLLAASLALAIAPLAQAEPELTLTLSKKPVYIEPAVGTPDVVSDEMIPFGINSPFETLDSTQAQIDKYIQDIADVGVNVISQHFRRDYTDGLPDFTEHRKQIETFIVGHGLHFWAAIATKSGKCFMGDIDGETHEIIDSEEDLANAEKCVPYSEEGFDEFKNWLNQALDLFSEYDEPGSINNLAFIQIGNEPDFRHRKPGATQDLSDPNNYYHDAYSRAIKEAYSIIKSKAPNAKIVIGTPATASVGIDGFHRTVLRTLYNNGDRKCNGTGCFDLFDYHLFGNFKEYQTRIFLR